MRFSADPKTILTDPIHFLAFGFGAGLSPVAPGTVGTLAALPFIIALQHTNLLTYVVCVSVAFVLGIFICGNSARRLGTHDHAGIVWDEFVGFAITLCALPAQWYWYVLGFLLFRLLDIVKPWPIREADHRLSGGLGIMLDDVIAGLFAAALLQFLFHWF